ncbi:unnamed protein product [Calicophoron daubneyi]|uniref:Ionotropic glutamate receptor L-glutamate and glycine-binding domain-containing protein n=1 Tax=Calicophoron daubneyi TaxID=300641 RepID=A0AAV2TXL2_CALDB
MSHQCEVSHLFTATVKVAFVGINRTDLAQSINSSATHLRSILKQTVTWTLYEYEEEQPSAHIQLFESVCTDLKNDSRPYPDILLDLSSDDEHSCFFGEIARQLDIGPMALNKPACVPFAVQSPFAKYSMVEIPAIRFPKSVPFNVLTAFSDVLFNANEAEIVYFTDKALGTQAVLGSSVSLKLSGRMNVHLQSPIDKSRLQKILTAMTQTIRVGAFVFIMDQPIMAELMDSEEILIIQQYPLSRNVIVFDTHANTSYCDVMCHVVDGVLVHCGAEYSAIQFYCIQIDMSEASASSLLNLQNGLNDIWSSMSTNQLDAAYTYDAVKTSVHTVASLIAEGQWGNHTAKDKSGLSGCTTSTRPLTNGTRFYKFAARLTQYPVSSGASGIINFTESFTNRKANFMLKFCDIFNELQGPTCRNMNASFSYEKQKLTVPEKLDLAQNRLELRVRIIPEDPFVIKTAGGYTGYCIELFEMIATSLGLPFVYVEQPDQNYGTVQPDGSWNGLIGSIAYRAADVGLGRLIVSSEAEKVVDFTSPTMRPAGIVLLMSTEGDMDTTIDYFVEIFSISNTFEAVALGYKASGYVCGCRAFQVD